MAERSPRRPRQSTGETPSLDHLLAVNKLAGPLRDPAEMREAGLSDNRDTPQRMVVEINLRHEETLTGASKEFERLFREVAGADRTPPRAVTNAYFSCELSMNEAQRLVKQDSDQPPRRQVIYRIWPDFPVESLIYRSAVTVKADAARRSFDAGGATITWAVIDSGIDGKHPHFTSLDSLGGSAADMHKDFTGGDSPLTDEFGHGSHVAGIIAGSLLPLVPTEDSAKSRWHVFENHREEGEAGNFSIQLQETGRDVDPTRLAGVAPHAKLVSLKVMDAAGKGYTTGIIEALRYVREVLNGTGKSLRVQGVNLSVGYDFRADWFACGQSPLCVEVDRLVRTGVVVVVAAGNTGYGTLTTNQRATKTGLGLTINDPGNAALAITVGATHRDRPHTYGVSFFSSKGPTADGRLKPDLVAPGERVVSCAAGQKLAEVKQSLQPPPSDLTGCYVESTGTSVAAPHVSGAIAAFLSIRQEFIGKPDEVKRIFLESATSLGRERYFEGHGLVDLMRAIQRV